MRFCLLSFACTLVATAQALPITDLQKLDIKEAQAASVTYRGKAAVKLTSVNDGLAAIKNFTFHNGVIDVDVAGSPSASAVETARGFIGIAFRIQATGRYERLYVRPTNGRASDQLRRNHSTQYVSEPEWPWERLRKESPGVYESYADLLPGEWTHLRIVVQGTDASLFVGGANQPCLVVHDLKLGDVPGGIALWTGPGTEGYFHDLVIK